MSIRFSLAVLAATWMVQPVFAGHMALTDKSCKAVVKSCLQAGYTGNDGKGKQFWQDCMKPVVLGKQVSGVTVDPKDVKACRTAKINELTKELSELNKAN